MNIKQYVTGFPSYREGVDKFADEHGWQIAGAGRGDGKTCVIFSYRPTPTDDVRYNVSVTWVNDVVVSAEKIAATNGYEVKGDAHTGAQLLDIVGLMLQETE